MAEERFRILDGMRRIGSAEKLSTLTRSPITFFDWLLARVLAGEPTDLATAQLEAFQRGFVPAEQDFANLRRHVCIAASALLVGRPPTRNAQEAIALAHRTWDGGWQKLDAAIEACAAAASTAMPGIPGSPPGANPELSLWRGRAMGEVSLDWVESYEEALYLLDERPLPDAAPALGGAIARICAEGLMFHATVSVAPLVCALGYRTGAEAPIRTLLEGQASVVDALVFGPSGDKPRIKVGKPTHEVVRSAKGAVLELSVKVTGRGPFSPVGYSLAPFTFGLAELVDRVRNKISRGSEEDLAAVDHALAGTGHAMTFRVNLARGVELSREDEAAFRARMEHSWRHVCRSLRDVHAEAQIEIVR